MIKALEILFPALYDSTILIAIQISEFVLSKTLDLETKGMINMPSWNESLKIGVPLIDNQHKGLFEAMDALYAACSAGKGRAEVVNTIEYLKEYTIKHFADEQELQRKSGYPKCAEHKKLHDDFIVQVLAIKKDIADNGPTILSVSKLNSLLSGWLINHIKYVDTEIAQYVNK